MLRFAVRPNGPRLTITSGRPRIRERWLRLALVCAGACAVLRGQPAVTADSGSPLSLAVLIDIHPQQGSVIEFERQVMDSLGSALAGMTGRSVVVTYSDRVHLMADWSPFVSGLGDASSRLALESAVDRTRGAALDEGLIEGLTRLGSSPDGDRRGLIVIGEGTDGESGAKFHEVLKMAKANHVQCFALLVASHRSQVGRVRQFGFDLFRLASETRGGAYDVRTNPQLLDKAVRDMVRRLSAPIQ